MLEFDMWRHSADLIKLHHCDLGEVSFEADSNIPRTLDYVTNIQLRCFVVGIVKSSLSRIIHVNWQSLKKKARNHILDHYCDLVRHESLCVYIYSKIVHVEAYACFFMLH